MNSINEIIIHLRRDQPLTGPRPTLGLDPYFKKRWSRMSLYAVELRFRFTGHIGSKPNQKPWIDGCQCLSMEIAWLCARFSIPVSNGCNWNSKIHSFEWVSTYFCIYNVSSTYFEINLIIDNPIFPLVIICYVCIQYLLILQRYLARSNLNLLMFYCNY